jgi:hypothetical protein
MPAVTLTTSSSPAMQAYLRRDVTLAIVRNLASTRALVQPRAGWVTEVDGGLQEVANRKVAGERWEAPVGTPGARPVWGLDATLGTKTILFDAARDRRMVFSGSVSLTAAWSMLAVFRYTTLSATNVIIGDEAGVAANRAGLQLVNTNRLNAMVGGVTAQAGGAVLVPGQWYAGIASYNGSNRARVWMPGRAVVTSGTVTTAPTGALLQLSDSSPFGFSGAIDLAGFFTVDLLDAAHAADFALVADMVRNLYGPIVDGH